MNSTRQRPNIPLRNRARRGGSVYVTVLGASMLIVVMGVSALMGVRIQRQAMAMTHSSSETMLLASSAIELGLQRLAENPNWRSNFTADTWTAEQQLGRGAVRFKLVSERGGPLHDDPASRVWLYGQGRIGHTVRTSRVLIEPVANRPGANLLVNAHMDQGTRAWFLRAGDGTLEYTRADSHTGLGSLWMRNRKDKWAGPRQLITQHLTSGQTYILQASVRNLAAPDTFTLQITTLAPGANPNTESRHGSAATAVPADGNWTQITATITPTWSGELGEATFRVVTGSNTGDFLLDNARLIRARDLHTMVVVTETWQAVVDP